MTFAVLAFLGAVWAYPDGGLASAVVAGVAAAVGYWLESRIWWLRKCRKCKGAGRFYNPTGTAWRPCPRCEGSGRATRLLAGSRS